MAFFIGRMKEHLEGHKELTAHNEILNYDPDFVSIPLVHSGKPIEACVKEGDEVKIGDLLGERNDNFYVPIYASCSGTIVGIEKKQTTSLKPFDHVVIKNNHKDEKAPGKFLKEDASKEEIIDYMKLIGLTGQGGAGFPAYFKFNTDKCKYLIINAVECEPYITSDARMIEEYFDYFKLGVKLMLKASNAKIVYITIKEYKKEMIAKLTEAFKDMPEVTIKPIEDAYPMGWERSLVYAVLKRRYEKFPIEVETIVANASSAINLARSSKEGTPIYEKIVTVSGECIKEPHNVKTKVGTSFKELIDLCGGYTKEKIVLLSGGPMMGGSVTKDEVCITPISNAITVMEYKDITPLPCLRCGKCVNRCPSGLQPCNVLNAAKTGDFKRLERLGVMRCVECGTCTYICPSKIAVTEGVRRAKKAMMLRAKK